MKYLFIIGEQSDFDSSSFRSFLQHIIDLDGGKPFQLFLYKFNLDILKIEYPYLHLEGEEKKFLALYPNMLLKCKDIGQRAQDKSLFQLYMGGVLGNSGHVIKSDQIEAIGVQKIVVLWEKTSDKNQ